MSLKWKQIRYIFTFSSNTGEWRRVSEVRVMPVLETPALKNPFCRRSGRDKRSGRERRMSVNFTKYSVDRRSGVDRRKGQDRRKHDYWNTNYRYWNTAVWWPEIGSTTVQPSAIHFSKNMKNIAHYVLWGILVLLLISFSAALLETLLHVRIHYYLINTVCVLALVALHYFKFRKSWLHIHSLTHKTLSTWLYQTHPANSLNTLALKITSSLISINGCLNLCLYHVWC